MDNDTDKQAGLKGLSERLLDQCIPCAGRSLDPSTCRTSWQTEPQIPSTSPASNMLYINAECSTTYQVFNRQQSTVIYWFIIQ